MVKKKSEAKPRTMVRGFLMLMEHNIKNGERVCSPFDVVRVLGCCWSGDILGTPVDECARHHEILSMDTDYHRFSWTFFFQPHAIATEVWSTSETKEHSVRVPTTLSVELEEFLDVEIKPPVALLEELNKT